MYEQTKPKGLPYEKMGYILQALTRYNCSDKSDQHINDGRCKSLIATTQVQVQDN